MDTDASLRRTVSRDGNGQAHKLDPLSTQVGSRGDKLNIGIHGISKDDYSKDGVIFRVACAI